ncbi:unnamed protein product [Periconia digitata]|uniref:Uncharacterized protein n=1 Tax=Periconia digitata TaxID=1303443 RepID=A0A9W4XPU5_9PLEO|nr:unnamed protein product [Periconia digitata]
MNSWEKVCGRPRENGALVTLDVLSHGRAQRKEGNGSVSCHSFADGSTALGACGGSGLLLCTMVGDRWTGFQGMMKPSELGSGCGSDQRMA